MLDTFLGSYLPLISLVGIQARPGNYGKLLTLCRRAISVEISSHTSGRGSNRLCVLLVGYEVMVLYCKHSGGLDGECIFSTYVPNNIASDFGSYDC